MFTFTVQPTTSKEHTMASGGGDWKDMYKAAERGDVQCVRFHLSEGVDADYQHPEVMLSALVVSIIKAIPKWRGCCLSTEPTPTCPHSWAASLPCKPRGSTSAQSCKNFCRHWVPKKQHLRARAFGSAGYRCKTPRQKTCNTRAFMHRATMPGSCRSPFLFAHHD